MTPHEYWLSEIAVTGRVQMRHLHGSEKQLLRQWNRRMPVMGASEVASALYRMLQRGNVCLYQQLSDASIKEVDWKLYPQQDVRGRIEDALSGGSNGDVLIGAYGLTTHGGSEWESEAKANWDLFWNEEWEERSVHLWAKTASFLERIVKFVGWPVTLGTIGEIEEVVPWEATYWKTFESGCHVTVPFAPESEAQTPQDRENKLRQWFTRPTYVLE